jgi:hypothetical protein
MGRKKSFFLCKPLPNITQLATENTRVHSLRGRVDKGLGVGDEQANVLAKKADLSRVFHVGSKHVKVVQESELERAVVALDDQQHVVGTQRVALVRLGPLLDALLEMRNNRRNVFHVQTQLRVRRIPLKKEEEEGR